MAGCCEHGNETSSSIKGGEFLDYFFFFFFFFFFLGITAWGGL
jgi:hypothetical protein